MCFVDCKILKNFTFKGDQINYLCRLNFNQINNEKKYQSI